MTTAQRRDSAELSPVRRGRGRAIAPAAAGRLGLWVFVLVNLAVVEAVFFTSATARDPLILVGKFIGLHLALLMMLQLILIARVPWLDRRIGMDRLTSWHRWTGFALFWAVVLHPTFILLGYSRLEHMSVWQEITRLAVMFNVLTGMLAATIVVVAVAFSLRFARRRLSYETWHTIHVLLYAAVTLALIHQALETTTLRSNPWVGTYWWTLWTLVLLALLTGRVVVPLRRNARHRLRVDAVVPESDNVVSVYVTGRDLDRLHAQAGQFFLWRFLGHNRWWQVNPFSLSAAPDGERLRLTAKAVGSTSAGLRSVPVGTRVFAEGPYGAFTTLHRTREATLLIAGGVGITPIRALLEVLTGPTVVLYRVRTPADAVLRAELEAIARERGAQVHILAGRTSDGSQPFDPENLRGLVPDITDRDVYVCGPPAMTSAVLRSLRTLRVPRRQIHAERFSLAG